VITSGAAASSPRANRYRTGARTFLAPRGELWDSWDGLEVIADKATRPVPEHPRPPGAFEHHDRFFDVAGQFIPTSRARRQGRPVIFQAGDSDEGRDFAAASADAIFFFPGPPPSPRGRPSTPTSRAGWPSFGRTRGELLIPARRHLRARRYRRRGRRHRPRGAPRPGLLTPQTALRFIEQLWNRELPGFRRRRAAPGLRPGGQRTRSISKGPGPACGSSPRTRPRLAREWRARAEAGRLSAREVVIEVTGRQFVHRRTGNRRALNQRPSSQADALRRLHPGPSNITPAALTPSWTRWCRCCRRSHVRADYTGTTLRDNLGLAPLGRPGAATAARAAS